MFAILQRMHNQWRETKAALASFSGSPIVRPDNEWDLLHHTGATTGDVLHFELRPVVFHLPERPNRLFPNLFVAAQGRIAIENGDCDHDSDSLVTHNFSTEVGYFRQKDGGLEHVFGAHYDFARDEVGHPAFHAQMKSFADDFAPLIVREFGVAGIQDDHVEGILQGVRLPTAQMDFFSFFLQVFADHLLWANSSVAEKSAFNLLLQESIRLKGAAWRVPRLAMPPAPQCYRAGHWYPRIA